MKNLKIVSCLFLASNMILGSKVETITFYIFYKFTIHCNYLHDLYCYTCNINLDMSLVCTITVLNIILHAQSCQRFLRKRNLATPPSPRKK